MLTWALLFRSERVFRLPVARQMDAIVFLHLSDLHIGGHLRNEPSSFYNLPLISGYNQHDYRLQEPLLLALGRDVPIRTQIPAQTPVHVVITGDVTAAGTDNDFATARALLHHRWPWRFGTYTRYSGFGWHADRVHTIPGNHDHWRNRRYPTAYSRDISLYLDQSPWPRIIESSRGRFRLELFSVDSNSGLEGHPARPNFAARGAISEDEFAKLRALLDGTSRDALDKGVRCVRVLLCHHMLSPKLAFFDASPLDEDSRNYLLELAREYRIPVVLTGHAHTFWVDDWKVRSQNGAGLWTVRELRCATTLQGPVATGIQGFWVHKLALDEQSSHVLWTAWQYQWCAKRFEVRTEPEEFSVPLSVP